MMHVDVLKQQSPLSQIEWKVVALAINEAGTASFGATGLGAALARAWRTLTGNAPTRPLADPRLEALRRFVGLSRRGSLPSEALTDTLMGFGYSPAQLAAVAQLSR